MPFLDGTEYRLLTQRTRAGGPIFWLANEANARDETFVNKMLMAEMNSMPFYWKAAISRTETLKVKRVPSPNGGHEVHVDHCNPDVTVDEDGRVKISGATLAEVKEMAQKIEAAEAGSSQAKAWLKQFDAKATESKSVNAAVPGGIQMKSSDSFVGNQDHYQRVRKVLAQIDELRRALLQRAGAKPNEQGIWMPLSATHNTLPELARIANQVWKQEFPSRIPLDLRGADFSGKFFVGDYGALNSADLRNAKLRASCWCFVHMKHADLSGADLRNSYSLVLCCEGSSFRNADLSESRVDFIAGETPADLSGANLSGATITISTSSRLKLTGANLAGAKGAMGSTEHLSKEGIQNVNRAREQFLTALSEEQRRQVSVDEPAKKSGCFIATAACGSAYTPEVITLQQFRDSVLMNSRLGRRLIDCYNCISPPLARQIEIRPVAKMLVRTLVIRPVAALIKSRMARHFDLK